MITGGIALTTLFLYNYGYVGGYQAANVAIVCGIIHFYTMEIDSNFVLHVRPFAYLPFPLSVLALAYTNYHYI